MAATFAADRASLCEACGVMIQPGEQAAWDYDEIVHSYCAGSGDA